MKDIEVLLLESLNYFKDTFIYHAVDYALMAGGKRLRPNIIAKLGEVYQVEEEDLEVLMVAMEWIHNYSLIHDDLPDMDDDDFRRGKLTVHKKFNEATAILAGDTLLNGAGEILFQHSLNLEGKRLQAFLKASYFLMKSAGSHGMIQGQMVDLHPSFDQKDYLKKTNALFLAAFMIPLLLTEPEEEEVQWMEICGQTFGSLYQYKDDVEDDQLAHYNLEDKKVLEERLKEALDQLEMKRPEIKHLRNYLQEVLHGQG